MSTAPWWGRPAITRSGTAVAIVIAAACGSSQPATTTSASSASTLDPAAREQADREQRERAEREHKAQLTAEHRKLESEQQDALAATCDLVKRADQPGRCLPSCYTFEPADPRAGTKLTGPVAIDHLVCQRPGADDAYLIADELDAKLAARAVRGRFPKPHTQGSWQEAVATTLMTALAPPPPAPTKKGRGKSAAARPAANADVVIVTGTWRAMAHPATKEKLRCVTVARYTKALRKPLDACAGDGSLGCEAIGDAAAHGINVVRYRLSEARRLQAAGKREDCQQAALEAVAVARGMPRWRQYAKLNVDQWADRIAYKTRFDGLLDEDTLFATVTTLGQEAESVFTSCGGAPGAPTTVAQEQSFHTCP
jgi:hypothetical protein